MFLVLLAAGFAPQSDCAVLEGKFKDTLENFIIL